MPAAFLTKPQFLDMAIANAEFILQNLVTDGQLFRVYKSTLSEREGQPGFLDDYAFVIEGLISLYEATFNEAWLLKARSFADYTIDNFYDPDNGMFFYTSGKGEKLIARKQEVFDNVIPSSNSAMANNLFKLGHFFDDREYLRKASQMLKNVQPFMKDYGSGYSNWGNLLLNEVFGIYEIAITGEEAGMKRAELERYYIPNKILLGGTSGSLPLLQDKWSDKTRIFICQNRTCQMPVEHISDALKQIT
jgi:uncharacterized protein